MTKHRTEFSTSGLYTVIDDKQISGKLGIENTNDSKKLSEHELISPAHVPIDQHLHNVLGNFSNTVDFSNENMEVPGNLTVGQDIRIKGHIQADEITIDVKKVILNMDYGYIEELFSKMQLHQLNQLLSHLDDLKLMIEKEKFERS